MRESGWLLEELRERVCAVIPAWNEAERIGPVLEAVRRYVPEVWVVDDGSTDGTAAVAHAWGAKVLRIPENRGKGFALRTAFAALAEGPYEAILTLDADGQHDPHEIPRLWRAFREGNADLVLGARVIHRERMPRHRRWNNRWIALVGSWLAGQRVPDFQSGFRLIRAEVLRTIVLETTGFETESELLVRAGRAGYRIGWVPVEAIYGSGPSRVRAFREILRFLRLFFRCLGFPGGASRREQR